MLKFWTAQYRYPGPYRLDITVKGKDPKGSYWAPTWDMVMDHKKTGNDQVYIDAYHKHIMYMVTQQPSCWEELLWEDKLVLVCFCPPNKFCHRFLLTDYLKQAGAEYVGEITDFTPWTNPKKDPLVIDNFQEEYRWLSNFWKVPMHYQGIDYLSNEHFYQAWKGNPQQRARIATCDKPKAEGKKIKLPFNWNELKNEVMLTGLRLKFSNPEMRAKLLATGIAELIEGNYWHDNYWGNCTCAKCADIPGHNTLGKMLMMLRTEIADTKQYYYCHHESEALWYSTNPNEDGTGDGLVCEITKERYEELLKAGWGESNQLKPLTGSTITPF